MRELRFRDRGRTYRVIERAGTVEQVQPMSQTFISSSVSSGGLYMPARSDTQAVTVNSQRVFVRGENNGEWTFDCSSDVPLRQGTRIPARFLGRGRKEPQLARLTNFDANNSWRWDAAIERFLPRYRTVWLIAVAVAAGWVMLAEKSNSAARARGYSWPMDAYQREIGFCRIGAEGCAFLMQALPYMLAGISALFALWYWRRRRTLKRLHEKTASIAL